MHIWFIINFNLLVGNKNDQPENKVVETEDAKRFALQMGVETFETSAKDNINIEEVFRKIFYYFLQKVNYEIEKEIINSLVLCVVSLNNL